MLAHGWALYIRFRLRHHVAMVSPVSISLAALLLVALVRLEHLVASLFWIVYRGRKYSRVASNARQRERAKWNRGTPAFRWELYVRADAGSSPWVYAVFFGPQASRLAAAVSRSRGIRKLVILMVLKAWKFYYFPVLTLILLVAFFARYDDPLELHSKLWFSTMLVLVVSSWVVAFAILVAVLQMGAFVNYHHLWPPRPKDEREYVRETIFVLGSALIASLCLLGLYLVAGRGLDAFEDFGAGGLAGEVLTAWRYAVVGLVGGYPEPANGYGQAVNDLTRVTAVGYLAMVGAVVAAAIAKSHTHTRA